MTVWVVHPGVITRQQALAAGLDKYFTGAACTNGHVDWRRIKNGVCFGCRRLWNSKVGTPRRQAKGYWRSWYVANQDAVRLKQQIWYQNNTAIAALRSQRSYARKKNAEGFFTQSDVDKIFKRQRGACVGCAKVFGKRLAPTIEHIIPLSRGGTNWPYNIQLMCLSCNDSKGPKLMSEWRKAA